MPKVTKVISGTSSNNPAQSLNSSPTFTTVYTVPTGKVARIEILLGGGIRTSDGSINMWGLDGLSIAGSGSQPEYVVTIMPINTEVGVMPSHVNYALGVSNDGFGSRPRVLVRNVTYLKAGDFVQVQAGRYSILVVEEDAG